jgi:uncharacterized protein YxeA
MGRFLAGVASALLLVAAGFFAWSSVGPDKPLLPDAPAYAASPEALADNPKAPSAPEKSKEEKRFNRYDKDKDGTITQGEYLLSRQKAYAKLDTNGDGTLSFNEYSVKTRDKFSKADGDRSKGLNRAEFATTKPVRKAKPKPDCPPATPTPLRQPETSSGDEEEAA